MCHNHSHCITKQTPQHWHKLKTHITPITHFQNNRENTITIHNKNISIISHQCRIKHEHSAHTALHSIFHQITKGFNNLRPLQCTVVVALDMSKAFDMVNIHKFIHKLTLTNIPNIIIIKFIANYIKEWQTYTQYKDTLSKLK